MWPNAARFADLGRVGNASLFPTMELTGFLGGAISAALCGNPHASPFFFGFRRQKRKAQEINICNLPKGDDSSKLGKSFSVVGSLLLPADCFSFGRCVR